MKTTYLHWLTESTNTRWWHDSAIPSEIEDAVKNGALGITTNPVLTYKSLINSEGFWKKYISSSIYDKSPEMKAEELLRVVAAFAAEKIWKVYQNTKGNHGYAFGQLDPSICSEPEKMLQQALRYHSWGENIAIKLPTVKSSLSVIEELAARGIAVCSTLNFSVSQALAAGEAYERGAKRAEEKGIPRRPCFVVQQSGRLDEYLLDVVRDNQIGINPEVVNHAGNAVCKKTYHLFSQRGIRAKIMPAGLRGLHHITELAGGSFVFSLQSRIQKMLIEEDPPRIERVHEQISESDLLQLYKIPDFIKAYDENGMKDVDFISFGLTQKTLAQFFWAGWYLLENYGIQNKTNRWY